MSVSLKGVTLWLRQLLIDTDSYSSDWPPPFNIKPGRHFALRGVNDEEVIENLKKQQRKYWVFNFVDLIAVAFLSKLSKVLENCALSFHSFLFVTSLFCLLFVTRMTADEYGVQFIAHDSFHIICYYIYFMSNFIMALNINVVDNHTHTDSVCDANFVSFGFLVGFVCSRAVILVLFSRVVVEDELWMESSKKTLGHELHDTTLTNCEQQDQWTAPDGEGKYIPCAQCAAHEFSDCDADEDCARCARHEECFWACKDSCNAILAQYPNPRFIPEDISYSIRMLKTLKKALIARRLFLAGFDARLHYPPHFTLTAQERGDVEQQYLDYEADGVTRRDKNHLQFDISRDDDVDSFASNFQEAFGENGEAVISLADEGWSPWFREMENREAREESGGGGGGGGGKSGSSCLLELKAEMLAKAEDVTVVHGFVKAFLASRDAGNDDWFVDRRDFDAVTDRLKDAVDVRHRRVRYDQSARAEFARLRAEMVASIDARYGRIGSSSSASGSSSSHVGGSGGGDEGLGSEIRKFLLDDREKFLRLARLHCLALLEPPRGMERAEDLRRRTFAKALYCTFFALLDSFTADKMRQDAKRNHVEHHGRSDKGAHDERGNFCTMVDLLYDEEILAKVSAQSLNNRGREQFGGTMTAVSVSIAIVSLNTLAEFVMTKGSKGHYPEEYKVYAYMLAILVEVGHNVSRSLQGKHDYYKIKGDFLSERLRDFLLLTLGEAIILLLAPYYRPDNQDGINRTALNVYLTVFSSCVLIFLFAYQYFEKFAGKDDDDEEPDEETEEPDAKRNTANLIPFLFKWLHLGLAICVFFSASALGILYSKMNTSFNATLVQKTNTSFNTTLAEDDDSTAHHTKAVAPTPDHKDLMYPQTLLATSVGFFVIFMTLLRSLKGRGEWSLEHRSRLLAKASKLLFAVFHFCLAGFSYKTKPFKIIAGHCVLLAVNTLSDGQTKGFFSKRLRARLTWLFTPPAASEQGDAEEHQMQMQAGKYKKKQKKPCATCGRTLTPGTCVECCSVQSRGFKRGKAVADRTASVQASRQKGLRATVIPSLGSVYNSADMAFTSNPLTYPTTAAAASSSASASASAAAAAAASASAAAAAASAASPGLSARNSVSRTVGRSLVVSDDPLGKSTAHRLSLNAARRNSASASASASSPAETHV